MARGKAERLFGDRSGVGLGPQVDVLGRLDRRDRVLEDHLLFALDFQKDDEGIEGDDPPLQGYAIHEIRGQGDLLFAERIQVVILKLSRASGSHCLINTTLSREMQEEEAKIVFP
jgi:hypothetical protein